MITHRRALATTSTLVLLLLGFAQAKTSPPKASCNRAASCNELGTQALKKGEITTAIQLFKLQVGYAEDAQDKKESGVAYDNLAVAYMRNQHYHRALAWTHLALLANSESEAAKHNLAAIEKRTADYRWPASIGGTYVQYAGRAQWSSFCVSKGGNDLDFRLIIYRMGAAWRRYGPAGYGDVKGKAGLTGNDEAQYTGTSDFPTCHIQMKFASDGVTLEQQGDCGFGHGVRAAGHYERINPTDGPDCDQHNLP
ncbi:MAG: hypothetical protein WBF04_11060 [Candidatus Sulfotelmatobacter sp.]